MFLGYTSSKGNGSEDFWLIKIDPFGNPLWDKTYGGDRIDRGRKIIQAADGGYAMLGTLSRNNHTDIYLVKVDAEGNME